MTATVYQVHQLPICITFKCTMTQLNTQGINTARPSMDDDHFSYSCSKMIKSPFMFDWNWLLTLTYTLIRYDISYSLFLIRNNKKKRIRINKKKKNLYIFLIPEFLYLKTKYLIFIFFCS